MVDSAQALQRLADAASVGEELPFGDHPDALVRQLHGLLTSRRESMNDLARTQERMSTIVDAAMRYAIGDYEFKLDEASNDDQMDAISLGLNMMSEEIRAATSSLAAARDEALKASTAKSRFLASMSHELRTPLNAIIGYAEIIMEEAPDEHAEDAAQILKAARQLLKLIGDVLDLSKVEHGRMEMVSQTFAIEPLCREVLDTMQPLAQQHGNTLRLWVDRGLSDAVADPFRLRQVLLNLLSNALKFTKSGRVELVVRSSALMERRTLAFEVRDTGIGLKPAQLERLFQPYAQAEADTAAKHGGTGLGLVISREFCQMMGGDLVAESMPGLGSTFTAHIRHEMAAPEDNGTGPRVVLVIDDDPQVHPLLARHLAPLGCTVAWAASASEGVAMTRELRPVLVTLDLSMPDGGGWGALAEIKRDPFTACIPVIMVSGTSAAELVDPSRTTAMGAADFLVKPVMREDLLRALSPFFGPSGSSALVVDDDPESRSILNRALAQRGWRVIEAGNGHEALERLADEHPDVVLVDLMMPHMDGFELIRRMRTSATLRTLPVVVISGMNLGEDERASLDATVQGVFAKAENTLVGRVMTMLGANLPHSLSPLAEEFR